jgi:hypothetical protein
MLLRTAMRRPGSVRRLLPADALGRTLVDGQLDLVFRSARKVDDFGMTQRLVEAEDAGTDFLAVAAGDARLGVDHRDVLGHETPFLLKVYWSRFDQTTSPSDYSIIGQKIILGIPPQKVTFAIQIISSTIGHFGEWADNGKFRTILCGGKAGIRAIPGHRFWECKNAKKIDFLEKFVLICCP